MNGHREIIVPARNFQCPDTGIVLSFVKNGMAGREFPGKEEESKPLLPSLRNSGGKPRVKPGKFLDWKAGLPLTNNFL
jgi:hypothetical protein